MITFFVANKNRDVPKLNVFSVKQFFLWYGVSFSHVGVLFSVPWCVRLVGSLFQGKSVTGHMCVPLLTLSAAVLEMEIS